MTDTKKAAADAREAKKASKQARAEALKAKAARIKSEGRYVTGFTSFIREQGIVGLAIGLAIGTQASTTVKSIVEGLINPIVSFVVGSNTDLTNEKWYMIGQDTATTNYLLTLGSRQLVFGWGQVLSALIALLAVAAVIYFVVKGLGLDKLDKKKE
jgi:large conductance mechanosensitive channel